MCKEVWLRRFVKKNFIAFMNRKYYELSTGYSIWHVCAKKILELVQAFTRGVELASTIELTTLGMKATQARRSCNDCLKILNCQ